MRQALQGKNTDRATLVSIAPRTMVERGLEPDFPTKVLEELVAIQSPAGATDGVGDLGDRLWVSMDNDAFRDPDQLTAAESLEDGRVRILADMVRKSAAALLLTGRIGESFDAIVTEASGKGIWCGSLSRRPNAGWSTGFKVPTLATKSA